MGMVPLLRGGISLPQFRAASELALALGFPAVRRHSRGRKRDYGRARRRSSLCSKRFERGNHPYWNMPLRAGKRLSRHGECRVKCKRASIDGCRSDAGCVLRRDDLESRQAGTWVVLSEINRQQRRSRQKGARKAQGEVLCFSTGTVSCAIIDRCCAPPCA